MLHIWMLFAVYVGLLGVIASGAGERPDGYMTTYLRQLVFTGVTAEGETIWL